MRNRFYACLVRWTDHLGEIIGSHFHKTAIWAKRFRTSKIDRYGNSFSRNGKMKFKNSNDGAICDSCPILFGQFPATPSCAA